jgi:hypothetical protein
MADADDLRRLALALPGTSEAPHMDRAAFRATRIFATLAADGKTANLKFTPEHQAFKAMLAPALYRPLQNGWGRMGWTEIVLAEMAVAELEQALSEAHAFGAEKRGKKPGKKRKG